MDLKHLKTFIAVAEELSFRKAATRLNLTQPPVSLQIRNLEEDLEVKLIERGGRKKMQLTAAGKILLKGARETLRVAVVNCRPRDPSVGSSSPSASSGP